MAAPAVVAPQCAEEARQQRGAQRRLLVGDRVDELDRTAAGVVRLQAELVQDRVADEGVAQRLDVPGSGQHPADAAVEPLAVGETAAGGGLGRVEGRFS